MINKYSSNFNCNECKYCIPCRAQNGVFCTRQPFSICFVHKSRNLSNFEADARVHNVAENFRTIRPIFPKIAPKVAQTFFKQDIAPFLEITTSSELVCSTPMDKSKDLISMVCGFSSSISASLAAASSYCSLVTGPNPWLPSLFSIAAFRVTVPDESSHGGGLPARNCA